MREQVTGPDDPHGSAASARVRPWGRSLALPRVRALPYILTLPLMVVIAVLAVYPTALTFIDSLFHIDPLSPPESFVGLRNYTDVFSEPDVLTSWGNTALYVLFGVTLSTLLALVMALGLRSRFHGRGIMLAVLILPWALPAVVEGVTWAWIYDPSFGVLNSVLHSLHLIQTYQLWISGNQVASIFFIELVQVWQITPLSAVLILASLQTIPPELYEAATVDGATERYTLRSITLPLIRPGLSIAIVQAIIQSFNVFDQVYVLNGNALTGRSIMMQTYLTAFSDLNFGQGYALSFLVTLATVIMSVGILAFVYRTVEF